MKANSLKKKIFAAIFLIAVIGLPLLSHFSANHGGAYAIAANHGYGSVDGAIIVGTAVNVGWALGLLCGVQLVVGLVAAG
ncbi:hypothetical protein [Pedobacter jamesrossensis]|uniref:Uncharacterized protein n=1 Tax=Pedobacter jamesrossensis TaxID=1908238 RepID=A0ABV8NIU4_9SPHI